MAGHTPRPNQLPFFLGMTTVATVDGLLAHARRRSARGPSLDGARSGVCARVPLANTQRCTRATAGSERRSDSELTAQSSVPGRRSVRRRDTSASPHLVFDVEAAGSRACQRKRVPLRDMEKKHQENMRKILLNELSNSLYYSTMCAKRNRWEVFLGRTKREESRPRRTQAARPQGVATRTTRACRPPSAPRSIGDVTPRPFREERRGALDLLRCRAHALQRHAGGVRWGWCTCWGRTRLQALPCDPSHGGGHVCV